ncbi:MAG: response regulator transcription factor [Rhodoferax sp.]|nr:response regulator transcription factor [Rhodoferax sp.]
MVQLVGTLAHVQCIAASSAEEGLRQGNAISDLALILLDPGLPGMNGVEAVRAFRRQHVSTPLIAVSASENRQEAAAALRAGANVVISKAVSLERLGEVIQRALAAEPLPSQWILPKGVETIGEDSLLNLTPRQREIIALLSQGHSNKEISIRLQLAEITVKVHVSAIFRALNVINRTQAVLAAQRLGLFDADSGGQDA